MAALKETIDLRKKPTLRELVMFGAVFIVMFAGFLEGLWTPLKRNLKKVEADAEILVQQREGIDKLLQTIEKEVAERQQTANPLDKKVADNRIERVLHYKPGEHSEEITTAVSLLSDRRFVRGLTVKEVNVGKAVLHKQYSVVPIEVKLMGRYGALIAYLQRVEELERPLIVTVIDMAADEKSGFLVAKLNVELYLLQ